MCKRIFLCLLATLICLAALSCHVAAEGGEGDSSATAENAKKVSPLWFGALAGVVAAAIAGTWFFLKRKDNT